MNPALQRRFVMLEARKRTFCTELATWPADRLRFTETATSWSALQLLEHLILTERSIAFAMRDNLNCGHPVTVWDELKNYALCSFMRFPVRVKVPGKAAALVTPGNPEDYHFLISSWERDRLALAEFLGTLANRHAGEGLFHHPVSGWTTASGTLRFIDAHLAHHVHQLARIRQASSSKCIR